MKNVNRYTKKRLHDSLYHCDICGTLAWLSESRRLDNKTGQGGALVCRRHDDTIDYGLVPYKVRAERPVKETRTLSNMDDNSNITGVDPFDLDTNNPLSSD